MRAMILAAGRGERLRPLTDTTPKPLIRPGRWRLIEYQILALKKAGVTQIVINVSWLAEQIREVLKDGAQYGVEITYSDESGAALETAGGIIKALPLLGDAPFIVCNADVWTDFDYAGLRLREDHLAHLVLVENPSHHPEGDFLLRDRQLVGRAAAMPLMDDLSVQTLTFSGIGLYHPKLFAGLAQGKRALAPILYGAVESHLVASEVFKGAWHDVGTLARFESLRGYLHTIES